MSQVRILYQDSSIVVVDKPPGFQVHTPEHWIRTGQTLNRNNLMKQVRNQIGQYVYPVHRLDRATSGVLVFALSPEIAQALQKQFQDHEVKKIYIALVRGWAEDSGRLDTPLTRELKQGELQEALTEYETLSRFSLPIQTREHHSDSRYSLLRVQLHTGRLHQIRRHLRKISHPIVGDTVHGDGVHNRLWKNLVQGSGLYLKAYSLEFNHPVTQGRIYLYSRWGKHWHEVFDRCGICPYGQMEVAISREP